MEAALLENVGSPAEPAIDQHLFGLVAEGIWQGVIADTDVGLGTPIRVESHDWSVTDPGGDGLTVYGSNGHYLLPVMGVEISRDRQKAQRDRQQRM